MTQKQVKQQNVIIKGTKDGLTFVLNDQCAFEDVLEELAEKLSDRPQPQENSVRVRINLVSGKRYLEKEQVTLLQKQFNDHIHADIDTIETDVITKDEAEEMRLDNQITRLARVIRSGQVIEVRGDLLLIGDVNPGGTIKATGNIYVLGALRGIAHAGVNNNKDAVICAGSMNPSQLRIADVISRPPEQEGKGGREMECAYVDEDDQMVLDRMQKVGQVRPYITDDLTL
ncbi:MULTISPECIES: septum site-determining protein MinC [Alteribacter]|uniref:Probable septum site-determining protein MinC n=1 Tax=Alteribacter keqinensis TaxID=2483800 RepID=A0A3M7TXA4_9BACI|nr:MULTISPECIES: septum site-determining protein MinC [Alteribacter]MBM7097991.1 septum site-determining protein MinC [Alteribacter salitolerans]RNA70206.1 septum site-determining protein MinC [Alteribacter keqinensis]